MSTQIRATPYPTLFSPIRIGSVTLRNRIVNLPQGMGYTNSGLVVDEDIAYHRRRALGGVGLVVTGGTATDPTSTDRTRNFVEMYDDRVLPGLRQRAEAVHGAGAHIVGQIFNLGRYMAADAMNVPPLGPSALRAPGLRFAPMAMGEAEIDSVIDGFRRSARNLQEAGCDGAEIHGAHGYLLAQFLSAASNQRDDGYGGNAARRRRLLQEVAQAVRAECGPDFVVGVRLSADDEFPGGTTLEEAHENAAALLDRVQVDYVSLAVGIRGTYVKDSSEPQTAALDRIAAVKAGLPVPVLASQRFRRPEQAEQALRAGQADLIGLARALIADPDWAVKAARGGAERIRTCVGDLQDCRSHLSGGLRCMINAEVGNELAAARQAARPRDRGRRVAVIGAGPAGLEAARCAAESGMDVTVYEAGAEPGGQLRLAARMDGRAELLDFVTYLSGELRAVHVHVHYGTIIATADAVALDADFLIVATGSVGAPLTARVDLPEPAGGARVHTVWDVLTGPAPASAAEAVLIDDGLGDWAMLSAAWRLAAAGTRVTIASAAGSVLGGVPGESQAGLRRRLRGGGIGWLLDVAPRAIEPAAVRFERTGTGEDLEKPADLVVVASGQRPVDALWREVREIRPGVVAIGDAQTPRTVGNAVRDAWNAIGQIALRGDDEVPS